MTTPKRALSYAIATMLRDGKPQCVASVRYSRCDAALNIPLNGPNNPALVERKAHEAGWLFHRNTARKCVCRECYLGASPKIATLAEPQPSETETMPDLTRVPSKPRAPTPEERMKIREFLDGNYDERRQCLLDGHTDQTAAANLGVPWAWVRDLREIAYGPLKGDGELMELRDDLTKLKLEFANKVNLLEQRLAKAEARIGV